MELIKISQSRLKIMLTSEDMNEFKLDFPDLTNENCQSPEARRALRCILEKAKEIIGFDTGADRVFIQLYPSREGGCEMFVSKTETAAISCQTELCASQINNAAERQEETRSNAGHKSNNKMFLSRSEAWRFDQVEYLIEACKRLEAHRNAEEHQIIHSSRAWIDEEKRYHLIIEYSSQTGKDGEQNFIYLSEYGICEAPEKLLLYISEHGKSILTQGAIEAFAAL